MTGPRSRRHRSGRPRSVPTVRARRRRAGRRARLATGIRRRSVGEDPLGGTTVAPEIGTALRRRQGGGRPLAPEHAERMGAAMGVDLGGVRIHDDGEADTIARSVQATAFTAGSDVYFTRGTYAPGTSGGDHLLAHELAHVVQGSSGRARRRVPSSARRTTPPRPPRTRWPTAPSAGCSARPPGSPRRRRASSRPAGPGGARAAAPAGRADRDRAAVEPVQGADGRQEEEGPRSSRRRRPCRPR